MSALNIADGKAQAAVFFYQVFSGTALRHNGVHPPKVQCYAVGALQLQR